MYAGSTLTRFSGRILGAHQKIDRVARRHLKLLLEDRDHTFPTIQNILKFEGKNGPDGIKHKSPAQNEPWHFLDPKAEAANPLTIDIRGHYEALIRALKEAQGTKAAFEASWLAHAMVDGLTPAHHYPYDEALGLLRGEDAPERSSVRQKLIMPGNTVFQKIANNWKMWGPRGIMSTHGLFELGVAGIIKPWPFKDIITGKGDCKYIEKHGLESYYMKNVRLAAALNTYQDYYRHGWTPRLAKTVRRQLVPIIIKTVTVVWYAASLEADRPTKKLLRRKLK